MNSLHKNISCRRWERAKLEMAFSSRNFFQISDPHVQKISWIPRVKHISCRGGEAVQLRTKSLTYGSLFIQVFMWGGNYLPYSKVYLYHTARISIGYSMRSMVTNARFDGTRSTSFWIQFPISSLNLSAFRSRGIRGDVSTSDGARIFRAALN